MSGFEAFRDLHAPGAMLVLANAWDAGSARLIAAAGARAIATTSSGVAWAHGYPDGDALPVNMLAATIAAIAGAVTVPVSADVEGGYATDPAAAAANVARIVGGGAAGINIEDGAGPPDLLAAKIAAIRSACGPGLFINARIDVYLKPLTAPGERLAEAARRMAIYRAAGADGLFVPGLTDSAEIAAAVAAAAPLPLNLMAMPALPGGDALRGLGVRRLSAGGAIAARAMATARRLAAGFLAHGDVAALFDGEALAYAETNTLMAR